MKPRVEKHLTTFEEFYERVSEDQKADLIDGVIHMASPESLEGNELVGWVLWLLQGFVWTKKAGKVWFERIAFRLADHRGPEPDIAFVRSDRLHLREYGYFKGPPDLAMEFVSPERVERDYETKRQMYQEAGVREYWIIDDTLQEVTLFRLDGDTFVKVAAEDGKFLSLVLPGFYLRPEWLWASPQPDPGPLLAAMLAG